MPMTYEIDLQKGEVIFTGTGTLTESEILDCVKAMRVDPALASGMPRLSDCTRVQILDISSAGFSSLIEHLQSTADPNGLAKNALVVSNTHGFGLGRMFSAMSEGQTDVELKVFYDLEEARSWLHAKPQA
jgi:hypothetical protein